MSWAVYEGLFLVLPAAGGALVEMASCSAIGSAIVVATTSGPSGDQRLQPASGA
jgi:hypothetical protein